MEKNDNSQLNNELSTEEIDILYKIISLLLRNNPNSGVKIINWTTFFSNLGI